MTKLPSEFDIVEVCALLTEITPLIDNNKVIRIDNSCLARFDTIGVPFIVAIPNGEFCFSKS